jgi:hypothetical protein
VVAAADGKICLYHARLLEGHRGSMGVPLIPYTFLAFVPGRQALAFDPAADAPPAGYLWNDAAHAGIKVRDYGGLWVENLPPPAARSGRQIKSVRDKGLETITDMNYRTFDLDVSDVDRAKEFLREWKDFDERGDAPQLLIMTMGNDHTAGTAPGRRTPFSYEADGPHAAGSRKGSNAVERARL